VCLSKHVEPSINFGIINSITSCILLVFPLNHTTMLGVVHIKSVKFCSFSWESKIYPPHTCPDQLCCSPSPLYDRYRSSFPGLKWPGRGGDKPSPSPPLCLHGMLEGDLYLCAASKEVVWLFKTLSWPRWRRAVKMNDRIFSGDRNILYMYLIGATTGGT